MPQLVRAVQRLPAALAQAAPVGLKGCYITACAWGVCVCACVVTCGMVSVGGVGALVLVLLLVKRMLLLLKTGFAIPIFRHVEIL